MENEQIEQIEPSGLRIAVYSSDEGMQQVELNAPRRAVAPRDTETAYYGAVVVRGGVTDADLLRTASAAVSSVQQLLDADEDTAGQPVVVEADVVRGSTRTSWPSMRTDVESAGGNWVETSRHPHESTFWSTLTKVFSRHSQSPE